MDAQTFTPSIEVAIGRELRLYHAYVTTAPPKLDAPATITLYTAPFSDVSGMAACLSRSIPRVPRHPRGSCSWTGASSHGNGRGTERPNTSSHQLTPYSSESTPCSTGCGTASAHRLSISNSHTHRRHQHGLGPCDRADTWR
jgi:hypothetical protein